MLFRTIRKFGYMLLSRYLYIGFFLGFGIGLTLNFTFAQELTVEAEVKDEVSSFDEFEAVELPSNIIIAPEKNISYFKNQLEIADSFEEIAPIQQEFFEKEGKYLQEKGKVNIYESPKGWGYQIIEITKDAVIYTGYGINSEDYSFVIPLVTATTTISISELNL